MWSLTGQEHGDVRKVIAMGTRDKATGTRQTWLAMIGVLAALLLASAGSSDAWGGHGGFHHGFHRFGGPHIGIGIGLGPFWAPYWAPYPYVSPPVVVPPAPVYAQPSPPVAAQPPPASWYYCDHPPGYYPYVQQCPGGWRQVPASPS
jgi:hypothetical protein